MELDTTPQAAPSSLKASNRMSIINNVPQRASSVGRSPREVQGQENWSQQIPVLRSNWKSTVPTEQLGLKVLNPDETDPAVDLIAVHGLGALPDKTWIDSESNTNWLKDFLPKDLPKTRVLRFGYDSQWLGRNAIRVSIKTIADKLLHALRAQRRSCVSRPIIFIAHCFGGLIVEKALVQAQQMRKTWGLIIDHTVGVAFLGTPHRGSDVATTGPLSQAAIYALIAQYSELRAEPGVLNALDSQHNELQEVSAAFVNILKDNGSAIQIMCFFEERACEVAKMINGKGKDFMVTQESAQLDGVDSLGLTCDHFQLNKFASKQDGNYIQILTVLEDFHRDATKRLNSGLWTSKSQPLHARASNAERQINNQIYQTDADCESSLGRCPTRESRARNSELTIEILTSPPAQPQNRRFPAAAPSSVQNTASGSTWGKGSDIEANVDAWPSQNPDCCPPEYSAEDNPHAASPQGGVSCQSPSGPRILFERTRSEPLLSQQSDVLLNENADASLSAKAVPLISTHHSATQDFLGSKRPDISASMPNAPFCSLSPHNERSPAAMGPFQQQRQHPGLTVPGLGLTLHDSMLEKCSCDKCCIESQLAQQLSQQNLHDFHPRPSNQQQASSILQNVPGACTCNGCQRVFPNGQQPTTIRPHNVCQCEECKQSRHQSAEEFQQEKLQRSVLNLKEVYGSDPDPKTRQVKQDAITISPLYAAVWFGDQKIAMELLECGQDVNFCSFELEYGFPLQAAAVRGDEPMVLLLLQHGADCNKLGGLYGSAMRAAAVGGFRNVVALLLQEICGVDPGNSQLPSVLTLAVENRWPELVQLLLDSDVDVNQVNPGCASALQVAAKNGSLEMVELLLDYDADIDMYDDYGDANTSGTSALYLATCNGHIHVMMALIESGADVELLTQYGTPLDAAVCNGQLEATKLLLERGAIVDTSSMGILGSLRKAMRELYGSHGEVADLILAYDANRDFSTTLESEISNHDIVRRILAAQPPVAYGFSIPRHKETFFWPGTIIEIIWPDRVFARPCNSSYIDSEAEEEMIGGSRTAVRRFIITKQREAWCYAVPINKYGPNASRYKYGGASDGLIKLCPDWVINLRGKMFSVSCDISADLSQSLGDHSYVNVRKCYLIEYNTYCRRVGCLTEGSLARFCKAASHFVYS